MISRLLTVLMFTSLIAGCGSPPPTYRSPDDFASLNLSSHSLVRLESLPTAPKGFTTRDVEALARPLTKMAELGTYNHDVWNPGSQRAAIDLVLKDLPLASRRSIEQAAREQLDGRPWANLVGNVFAVDIDIEGEPMMQRASWDVSVDRKHDHSELEVRLQTRTFYVIRHREQQSVVVVTRTWGLSSPSPVDEYYPRPYFAADAIGSDACDFILNGVITPDPDDDRYAKDMQEVLNEPSTKFVEPTGDSGEATAKACRDDAS